MDIVIRGFNASGLDIENDGVSGSVVFVPRTLDGASDRIELPTPRLAAERGPQGAVKNLSEFQYIIEQRIPKAIAESILLSANEKYAEFHFCHLKVMVKSGPVRMRIPLWTAMTVRKPLEQYSSGQIVFATVNATL